MSGLQSAPASHLELPGLTVTPLELETLTSRFDLTLSMSSSGGRLGGLFEYSTELFDAETIKRIAAHYVRLLDQIVATPDARIDSLPLMAAAEAARIAGHGTGVASAYPQDATLGSLFVAAAARHGSAVAVEDGPTRLSYAAVATAAGGVAERLRD